MKPEDIVALLKAQNEDIKFNEASHRYWYKGKPIPNYTSLAREQNKPQLNDWMVRVQQEADINTAWKIYQKPHQFVDFEAFDYHFRDAAGQEYEHQKQAREAADLGSQVHALIEKHIKTQLGIPYEISRKISDEAQFLFAGWLDWAKTVDLRPVFVEGRVVNEQFNYAGTIDLGAYVNGRLSVLDWKTKKSGKRPWIDQAMQNVAYRQSMFELTKVIWTGHLVMMPKDGGAVTSVEISPDDYPVGKLWDAFKACISLYEAKKAYEKK